MILTKDISYTSLHEQIIREPNTGEGIEQPLVKVVRDPAAVLHLAEHEAHGLPADAALRVKVVQVVHDELGAGVEVGPVELVRYVPAEGAEFSALLYQNRFLWP